MLSSIINKNTLAAKQKINLEHKDSSTQHNAPSLFTNHILHPSSELQIKLHIKPYQYWISGVLLLAFILFVWLRVAYKKQLKKMFILFFTNHIGLDNRATTSENLPSKRYPLFLAILFLTTLPLFIYQLLSYYNYFPVYNVMEVFFYLGIVGLVVSAYILKYTTAYIIGFIINMQQETSEYLNSILLSNRITGFLLFPIALCGAFLKQVPIYYSFTTGCFLLIFLFVYRLFRMIESSFYTNTVSIFYLFLYICALEILPLILLIKLFIEIT